MGAGLVSGVTSSLFLDGFETKVDAGEFDQGDQSKDTKAKSKASQLICLLELKIKEVVGYKRSKKARTIKLALTIHVSLLKLCIYQTNLVDGRANNFVTVQRCVVQFSFLTSDDAKGSKHCKTAVFDLVLAPNADLLVGFAL